MFIKPIPVIPLQTIQLPLFSKKKIKVQLLRTDKSDPVISGNKWFKLKHNLIEAKKQQQHTLLSFGGAYSNHLHALATAGKTYGFHTIGIIRGEEHLPLNPTLADITAQGMKLYYINRKLYREKHQPEFIDWLKQLISKNDPFSLGESSSEFYLVPEGGTNALAVSGAAEIASFIPKECDYVCVPCGTGGTIAGIISGLSTLNTHQTKVLGFAAMKGGQFLQPFIEQLLQQQNISSKSIVWELFYDWHFGGFARIDQALALFIQDFEKKLSIELDPVYTAKMMYAMVSMIEADFFPPGSNIIAIHTGGLQGKRGMAERYQSLLL